MRLTIRQLSADTYNKDGSIGLGNQILTLLYGLVRIHTQQLLGMDEVNLLGQERLQLTVAFTNEELRTQDRSIDSLYDILQALQCSVFLPDNSLPVPLIHIERMQVVQFLVSTDSIHISIDSVARLHIVFSQCQPFPFGQRMNHLGLLVSQILNRKGHRTLHAIQVIIDAKAFQHEQRSRHTTQPQLRTQVLLEEFLNQFNALLRLFHVQFRPVINGQ